MNWPELHDPPTLASREVHVWYAGLDLAEPALSGLRVLLSEDELGRAERLVQEQHRARAVAARGQLRLILARYLRLPPREIRFRYGRHGKPSLCDESVGLHFNLSHSGPLALYAITCQADVGIDVEQIREIRHLEIAERCFSSVEVASLRSLSADEQQTAFFKCWTRKEAYLKATGMGLSLPLDSFDVSFAAGEQASVTCRTFIPPQGAEWCLHPLEPARGYTAAVVVRGGPCRLLTFKITPGASGDAEPADMRGVAPDLQGTNRRGMNEA